MNKIVSREVLNSETVMLDIEAPAIARKALPGQFIIFRVDELGERVPLTVAGTDTEKGTVRIIFQMVGKSTMQLGRKQVGETIASFVGPLGKPSELDHLAGKNVAVIGGGLGTPSPIHRRHICTELALTLISSQVSERWISLF